MLLRAISRQVEGVVYLVLDGIDMRGRMLFDILDDLFRIVFQMIGVFDECVAGAGDSVVGHIDKVDPTPRTNFSNGVCTP